MKSCLSLSAVLKWYSAALVVGIVQASCGPGYQAPPVDPQLAKISGVSFSRLERGYVVHQAKCAKCHPFENPAEYDPAELRDEIMPEMARKSKLDRADQEAVLAYLLAARQLSRGS